MSGVQISHHPPRAQFTPRMFRWLICLVPYYACRLAPTHLVSGSNPLSPTKDSFPLKSEGVWQAVRRNTECIHGHFGTHLAITRASSASARAMLATSLRTAVCSSWRRICGRLSRLNLSITIDQSSVSVWHGRADLCRGRDAGQIGPPRGFGGTVVSLRAFPAARQVQEWGGPSDHSLIR